MSLIKAFFTYFDWATYPSVPLIVSFTSESLSRLTTKFLEDPCKDWVSYYKLYLHKIWTFEGWE